MFQVFATNVVVSKGYEDNPALRFSGTGDCCVQFRVGEKVYDTNAENNTRWVNHSVKAYKDVCERIKKMQIKAGSLINFTGKLVEEVWEDSRTKEKKSMQVVVLTDIEYAYSGTKKTDSGDQANSTSKKAEEQQAKNPENSENFDGYAPFGDEGFFDND